MTITAKFASICPCCNKPIQPGQQVEWGRGQKARHTDCCAADQAPAAKPAPTGPRNITVAIDGRRAYIAGDTMAVRGLLKDGGCHWDAERKAWWIGSAEKALELAEAARTAKVEAPAPEARSFRPTICKVCGGKEQRDHRGYVTNGIKILRSGECVDCYEERKMGY